MAVISYKCPNCDGELVFSPATQNFKCEYCMSTFSREELEAMKQDLAAEEPEAVAGQTGEQAKEPQSEPAGAQEEKPVDGGQAEPGREAESAPGASGSREGEAEQEEAVAYTCPSCGAQIVTDGTTAATFCYYCHNPVVLSGRLSGAYLPDKVIPFAIDKKQATQKFLDYVHSKKFIPRAFFRKQQIEKLSGVYFPYWVYACTMDGTMDAQGTNIRVWRSGETEYTETKYYQVEREGTVELSDLTKNALKEANQKLAEGVLPYDLAKMEEFHMGYLSGFLAQRRDVEREELAPEVSQEVKEYGRQLLRDTISGYSGVTVNSCNLKTAEESWSYVLLPVWTLTYKARNGKFYYYSMNGQTGKVYGELPVDYKKVGIVGGIVALLVWILFLIGGLLI